jgi:ferritin-like metal-binding protein YciE
MSQTEQTIPGNNAAYPTGSLYNGHSLFITGLHNAHAMETQAIQILTRQVERLETYPEMEAQLRRHIAESETQRDRLDEVLAGLEEKHSMLKDTALGFVGNMMALAHTPAADEVIKNTLANFAFEHFEIAAYESLSAIAEALGHPITAFQTSLKEEEAMALWIRDHIGPTTLKYLALAEAGAQADR